MEVQIVLGTYNLGRYLDQFMRSLSSQDHSDWVLLARDDASTDDTREQLDLWGQRLGARMEILSDSGQQNLGCPGNFSRLLSASSARYVMLADPDDEWLPNKISTTLAVMRRCEGGSRGDQPCLVHTDLTVADEELRVIAPSFWKCQGLTPNRGHAFSRMMVENQVCACTTMLNRPLVELVGEIPRETIHQDWWIALVAAAFGRIASVSEPTLLWRRHGANSSQVSPLPLAFWRAVSGFGEARERLAALLAESRPRVWAFLNRYREQLGPDQREAAEAFLALPSLGALARRRAILRHDLMFTSPLRNIGLLALI